MATDAQVGVKNGPHLIMPFIITRIRSRGSIVSIAARVWCGFGSWCGRQTFSSWKCLDPLWGPPSLLQHTMVDSKWQVVHYEAAQLNILFHNVPLASYFML
jgi:hypothetical protein